MHTTNQTTVSMQPLNDIIGTIIINHTKCSLGSHLLNLVL